jgi:hypothetical protein
METIYQFLKDIIGFLLKKLKGKLSKEEKEILITASEVGTIIIVNTDQVGKIMIVGSGKDKARFFKQDDKAYTARYIEALDNLCIRGLFKKESEKLFKLTGTGFEIARKLDKRR